MGINIIVADGYTEHPEWDDARYAGDRDIAVLVATLPHESRTRKGTLDFEGEREYRPSDFTAWRIAAADREWPNPGRFEHLIDLLENDPEFWIYLSW